MLKKLKDGQRREVTPEEMDPSLREGVSRRNARALAEQIAFGTLKRREKHDKS